MVQLANGFVVLTAFLGNILYIDKLTNVRDSFICISKNNERNESWPQNWFRMETETSADSRMFKYNASLLSNLTKTLEYKLRFYYFNNSFIDSNWNPVLTDFCTTDPYRILFYSSIVLLFIVIFVFLLVRYK